MQLSQSNSIWNNKPSTVFFTIPSGHKQAWLAGPERTHRADEWHVLLLQGLGTGKTTTNSLLVHCKTKTSL